MAFVSRLLVVACALILAAAVAARVGAAWSAALPAAVPHAAIDLSRPVRVDSVPWPVCLDPWDASEYTRPRHRVTRLDLTLPNGRRVTYENVWCWAEGLASRDDLSTLTVTSYTDSPADAAASAWAFLQSAGGATPAHRKRLDAFFEAFYRMEFRPGRRDVLTLSENSPTHRVLIRHSSDRGRWRIDRTCYPKDR